MTRERLAQLWPVMQAWKDGRDVQWRVNSNECWLNVDNPNFEAERCEWRIKPEPRRWWIVGGTGALDSRALFSNEDNANKYAALSNLPVIPVHEILPKVVPINKESGTGWTVAYNLIQKIQDRASTHMPDGETVSMEEVESVILALHNAGYLTMEKLTP